MFAKTGVIKEAATLFQNHLDISGGGVLCALPALLANGLLQHPGYNLKPGYYSLHHIILCLAFITLLRIKNIEQLRYHNPGELGILLGLDRVPEAKTMRSKLQEMADQKQAAQWSANLSEQWLLEEKAATGFLYIDGHVKAYYGSRTNLPRRYVSRERLCLRGMTDFWVNNSNGKPFFVISKAHNEGLVSTLKHDVVPRLLKEIPNQPTDEELAGNSGQYRFCVIFDREGFSPDLFKELWEQSRIACFTYDKYPGEPWRESDFASYLVSLQNGEKKEMLLAEQEKILRNGFVMREIRRLTKSGHQTSILTSDYISKIDTSSAAMFARWSQENFFKYMIQEFGIDKLAGYELSDIDETIRVVNPAYRAKESAIKKTSIKLYRAKQKLVDQIDKKGLENVAEEAEIIDQLSHELSTLKSARKNIKKHINIGELPEHERFQSIYGEKKQIMNLIKMIAYRAETAMADIIRPNMRQDQARTLLKSLFAQNADIMPDEKNDLLTVTIHAMPSHHHNAIIQKLLDELNQSECTYPGTNLKLQYKLVAAKSH